MENPRLIATPFAESGTRNDIPESGASEPQLATMQGGFPAKTQTPISEGGIPPERADFNGAFHLTTSHLSFLNKGKWYGFDAAFAGQIGGYDNNAILMLDNGELVQSTQDGNTNNPNVNMTGWINLFSVGNVFNSVASMLLMNNPKNNDSCMTVSYIAGQRKGGNTYIYDSSKSSENDGGTVINGWVCQGKNTYTVWDFGYSLTDAASSTIAVKNWLENNCVSRIGTETLDKHNYLEVNINHDKVIFGTGKSTSIVNAVKIVSTNGSFLYKGFKLQNLGLNYALFFNQYNQVFVDDYEAEVCYDGVLIGEALSTNSQAIVQNSNAIKAARIGFTADLHAENVSFLNCKTTQSRQGFHIEVSKNVLLRDCTADRCGNDAPTPTTDQPIIYAGGFRFHNYENLIIENCKNINKSGTNIDWLGGGGKNLKAYNCYGIDFVTDDVAVGTIETYTDILLNDFYGGLKNQNYKARFSGTLEFNNVQTSEGIVISNPDNTISTLIMQNVTCGRVQLSTNLDNAVLVMENVSSSSQYYNNIEGFSYHNLGDIAYSWLSGDDSQYPTLGYRFISSKAKTFNLRTFTAKGRPGGSQLSLESVNNTVFKGGFVGKIIAINGAVDALIGIDFNALNITYPRKANAVSNATGTDNTATVLNDLIAKLRISGVVS